MIHPKSADELLSLKRIMNLVRGLAKIAPMPRFFFDLCHGGDVYHDARGGTFKGFVQAKATALDLLRRFPAGDRDLTCTIRDTFGRSVANVSIKSEISGREAFGPQSSLQDDALSKALPFLAGG
ncbi:hypothetical protein [Mesorhizobium sp. B2-7-2]|uniref:DUF6894 family protein n=1 Tax=Mesorhizobium sp. B2-7-2 TaxID=2589908 RepID=UPI00112BC241|nr:hypothetical protein [Mesorhizobium sp. B2-7-2]TPJ30157.1 hypothetical protein FJ425_05360 [Mesorhizobium sp. B2-7-2]